MWIEIIQSMENLYAQLADNQAELERKNQELSQAKEFIENVLDNMADALVVTDNQGKIRRVNRATLKLLGYKEKEILGKPVNIILDLGREKEKSSMCYPSWLAKKGKVHNIEMSYINKKGEEIPVSVSASLMRNGGGRVIGTVMVARDMRRIKQLLQATEEAVIAERKKAQELQRAYEELQNLQAQLVQSEKLASIGRLAAGVAHEINNPLTGVLTFTHLLLADMPCNSRQKRDLEIIIKEASRCKLITQNLLDFARQTEPQKRTVDINGLVKEVISLVENQASFQNVKIIKEFNPSLPLVLVDSNQIKQVFMNVILNAQEAMPQGGFLTISTDFSEDGKFLDIKFIDTGCGIPKKNLEKIFDPFFTTKEVGKGTGLGLAVSYGIIKSHGGDIRAYSKEGKGTTILIKLPINKRG